MADDTDDRNDNSNNILPFAPPKAAKLEVTLSLDPEVLRRFRIDEPGWEARINDALRSQLNKDSKS